MHSDVDTLIRWARASERAGFLTRVTLGQLMLLLELSNKESVAAIWDGTGAGPRKKAKRRHSAGVNYRQKLQRLSDGLKVGGLTVRRGLRSQLNAKGKRLAGEVRLLLRSIHALSSEDEMQWHVAAGDSWIQSLVLPSLAQLRLELPECRWRVSNLDQASILQGIEAGYVHFGVIRAGVEGYGKTEVEDRGLSCKEIELSGGYDLFAGEECDIGQCRDARSALVQLLRLGIPLVQFGRDWGAIRDLCGRCVRDPKLTASLRPDIETGTYLQAAFCARRSRAWCVVPSAIAKIAATDRSTTFPLERSRSGGTLLLVHYPRVLDGIVSGDKVMNKLWRQLRRTSA